LGASEFKSKWDDGLAFRCASQSGFPAKWSLSAVLGDMLQKKTSWREIATGLV